MFSYLLRLGAAAVVAAAIAVAPQAAQAKWLRAESEKFVVYSDGDEMVLRQYVSDLDIYDALLRHLHGMPVGELPPRKLEIYLVKDSDALQKVEPRMGEGIVGFYSAGLGDVFAVAIRTRGNDGVLKHEYVHHFMMQYFPSAYPGWLIEGYAEYFDTATIGRTDVVVGKWDEGRVAELQYLDWLPARELLANRFSQLEPEKRGTFYGQSWLLTHYMMSDPARYKKLLGYMQAVGAGADPVEAMEKALGQTPEALDKALRNYLKGRLNYTSYTRSGFSPPKIVVTTLPPSADELLLDAQRLRKGGLDEEDGKALLARIRTTAARFPGDRLATMSLARAELEHGDAAAGRALIETLLAANPEDAEALQVLGVSVLTRAMEADAPSKAEFSEASRLLARSHKASPDNYRTMYYFAASRQIEPSYPSDNTLEVLEIVNGLAPQVDDVRIQYADALMRRKRWEDAAAVLGPVANDPHGGGGATTAKEMLGRIAAARKASAAP